MRVRGGRMQRGESTGRILGIVVGVLNSVNKGEGDRRGNGVE